VKALVALLDRLRDLLSQVKDLGISSRKLLIERLLPWLFFTSVAFPHAATLIDLPALAFQYQRLSFIGTTPVNSGTG
jgi:hypothetical protein